MASSIFISPGTGFSYDGTNTTFNGPIYIQDGIVSAPGLAFASETNTGLYRAGTNQFDFAVVGGGQMRLDSNIGLIIRSANSITWAASGLSSTVDTQIVRDTANTVAIKNATNQQFFRVYGTTTASKYLEMTHNGTNAVISASSGSVTITGGVASFGPSAVASITVVGGIVTAIA